MVLSVIAIVSGIILTSIEPSWHDQLQGAARVVVTDLAAARELAVTNNSSYKITFDRLNNLYYLEHSGTNNALDTLPETGFGSPTDSATRRTTDFSRLPFGTSQVRLYVVQTDSQTMNQEVSELEFGPLGETTLAVETLIWLAVGQSTDSRYLCLQVNPVTGLAAVGDFQTTAPSITMQSGSSGDPTTIEYGSGTGTGTADAVHTSGSSSATNSGSESNGTSNSIATGMSDAKRRSSASGVGSGSSEPGSSTTDGGINLTQEPPTLALAPALTSRR